MQSFDEALNRLLASAKCLASLESLAPAAAFNRVLGEDVYAPIAVPPFNNSAMDGIAFSLNVINPAKPIKLAHTVFAGQAPPSLAAGEACRIFTGAAMPAEADTVVLQENCSFDVEGQVSILEGDLFLGQNVRKRGEDLACGELVLTKGVKLSSSHVGLLASLGFESIAVYTPLKVAVISTGDELKSAGEALSPGQIYNSNGPMLCAALTSQGFEAAAFHVKDDLAQTMALFEQLAQRFDVLLSIGGVSVGDADFVKQAIESLGHIDFWKVAMKPGKPLAFGEVSGRPLIGLPGNPVSAFASYQLFASAFLSVCQGGEVSLQESQMLPVILETSLTPKRETFLRVSRLLESGKCYLQPFPSQGSGILSSVAFSEGFARIPSGGETQSGDLVRFIPFH